LKNQIEYNLQHSLSIHDDRAVTEILTPSIGYRATKQQPCEIVLERPSHFALHFIAVLILDEISAKLQ
jgi:hypothetical protein